MKLFMIKPYMKPCFSLQLKKLVGRTSTCRVAKYSSATQGNKEDFLHRSELPTEFFQRSLPRLPLPKLSDSCAKYLSAQAPLLSAEEHANTTQIVDRFQQGEGQELHKYLVQMNKRNKHTSYISAPWSDMYLKDRRALALNHNPFMAFNDDPNPENNQQLVRATNMVVSAMRFLKTYRASILEPEVFHLNPKKSDTPQFRKFVKMFPQRFAFYGAAMKQAYPLDMSQFPKLFNSTRIPRPEKDELFSDMNAKHLLVMRKGHFYVFDVFDRDGNILPATEILANMKYILEDNVAPAEHPLGVLTTQPRDFWTEMRSDLLKAGNEAALNQIDGAVFNLVLDDEDTEDPIQLSKLFLHGDGTNRWYDKSFSLILAKNGKGAVNFEHAWGDGVAVLRFFNEVFTDTTQKPQVNPTSQPASIDPSSSVTRLDFTLTNELKQGISSAKENFRQLTDTLDLTYHKNEKFGRNFLKTKKLSPDAFMQLAIQMSYHRLTGGTAATYESCSTAAFKHGRTETIRSCTMDTKNACQLFHPENHDTSVGEMQAAMEACSKTHSELTKQAAMGKGFDRHLFALKYYCAAQGLPLPDLYTDPAYTKLNHILLSTSTLTSPAVLIGGFAPVVPDGFGVDRLGLAPVVPNGSVLVGYGINDTNLGCVVTTYKPTQIASDFVEAFKQSVEDMHTVLSGSDFRK